MLQTRSAGFFYRPVWVMAYPRGAQPRILKALHKQERSPWVFAHFWAGVKLDGLDHLLDWKARLEKRAAVLKGLAIPPLPDLANLQKAGQTLVKP